MNTTFNANVIKTLAIASTLISGLAGAALPSAAQADSGLRHCTAIVNAVIEGAHNVSKADVQGCAEFGLRVSGRNHKTDAIIRGKNWVSIGQLGVGTRVYLDVRGHRNEVGALIANGARLEAYVLGKRNKVASYMKCGKARIKVLGNDTTVVLKGGC